MTGRYARNPDFIFRKIADEVILVPVRSTGGPIGSVFTLNEVGAAVWDLLDGSRTIQALRDLIVERFDVDSAVAETDVREFIVKLEKVRAVLPIGEGD